MLASIITHPIETDIGEITNGIVITIDIEKLRSTDRESYISSVVDQISNITEKHTIDPNIFRPSSKDVFVALAYENAKKRYYNSYFLVDKYVHMIIRRFDHSEYPKMKSLHPFENDVNLLHRTPYCSSYEFIFLGEEQVYTHSQNRKRGIWHSNVNFVEIIKEFCEKNGYHACDADGICSGECKRIPVVKYKNDEHSPIFDRMGQDSIPYPDIRRYPNYLGITDTFPITWETSSLLVGSIPCQPLTNDDHRDHAHNHFATNFIRARHSEEVNEEIQRRENIPATHHDGWMLDVFYLSKSFNTKPFFLIGNKKEYRADYGQQEYEDVFFASGKNYKDISMKWGIIKNHLAESTHVDTTSIGFSLDIIPREKEDTRVIGRLAFRYREK